MPHYPVLKPREVIAILRRLGFEEVRQTGSHKQFRHVDGRATTVPYHVGCDLPPSFVKLIAQQIGVTLDEFFACRK